MNRHSFSYLAVAAMLIGLLILSPDAQARAGGGHSSGSRGMRTYQSHSFAQPISRSTAPRANPTSSTAIPAAAPASGGFFKGLIGGLIGAGLIGLLMGHGLFASGFGGALGSILQIAVIIWLARLFMRAKGKLAASPMNPQGMDSMGGYAASPFPAPATSLLTITDEDKQAFEQLLQQIQRHWSDGDLNGMRQYLTSEMSQYLSEELSANVSRGLANKVENVTLQRAEITESWHEYNLDYVTARLQWSAMDYLVRLDRSPGDADYVAEGSPSQPVTSEEFWTFARAQADNWVLSAIQQVAA